MVLDKLLKDEKIDSNTICEVFESILNERCSTSFVAAFLMGLNMKGIEFDDVLGAQRAILKNARDFHPVSPAEKDDVIIDTCGTGGDGHSTFNISTTVAVILSAMEMSVVKHGNRSVSSNSGSADLVSLLGYPLDQPDFDASRFARDRFCFLFAPNYHPAMRVVAPIRRDLKIRTIFNVLGPLVNPAPLTHQVMGVFDENLLSICFRVLKEKGLKSFAVLRAADGMDEISPEVPTRALVSKDGDYSELMLSPPAFGFDFFSKNEIKIDGPQKGLEVFRDVVAGNKSKYRDAAVMNASFCLWVAGKANDFNSARELIEEALDKGAVADKVKKIFKK